MLRGKLNAVEFPSGPENVNFNSLLAGRRLPYLLGALFCAGLIAFALHLQYQQGEDPCPLCIFQRVAVIASGCVFLLAFLHGPRNRARSLYAGLLLLSNGVGAAIAARHVWIQHLPKDQVPECGPGLSYLLDTFPVMAVLRKVLSGSGECATVGWTFLGFSIPEWTLLCFVIMMIWGLLLARRSATSTQI
ncbi:MAG: disulfide bond formation protein B [Pseudomonadota bacterium]|nr:disulfide bond formation protein B [Pseudomonadota bacterium]